MLYYTLYPHTTVLVFSPLDGLWVDFSCNYVDCSNIVVGILVSWCICAEASNEFIPRVELLGQRAWGLQPEYILSVFPSGYTDLYLLALNKQPLHSISCQLLVLSLWF